MTLEDDVTLLSQVELFQGFSPEQLKLIAFGCQKYSVAANGELFFQGQPSEGGYIVIEGIVDLVETTPQGSQVLRRFEQSSLLGEIGLITPNEHFGTAMAVSNVMVLKIPRAVMRRVLEEYPELAALLFKRISASLNEMLGPIGDLEKQFAVE